jgi:ankyrin repeat protein
MNFEEGIDILLKQKSIDINYKMNENNLQAIHVACLYKNNEEILTKLIKKGANINAVCDAGTPLEIAIRNADS